LKDRTVAAIRTALEKAGVEFIPENAAVLACGWRNERGNDEDRSSPSIAVYHHAMVVIGAVELWGSA